jgi:cytoskeleton protein RodZ
MANNESFGSRLKNVRLEKGISLEDAHKHTKIPQDVLTAIEDDDHINLNPVYLKGFLKIYCGFLGVDLPEIKDDKKQSQTKQIEEKSPEGKPQFCAQDISRKLLPALVPILIVVAAVGLVFVTWRFVASRLSAIKNVKHAQVVRVKKEKIARQAAAQVRQKTAVSETRLVQEESLRLGVRALEDCWLQVKADNKVVFQNILKKGRFESWEADDRMDLVLGSAGGVQLEINGKILPSLGKRGQVLKNIVITKKDGLQVGK